MHWRHACSHPELLRPELTPEIATRLRRRIVVGMLVSALAIAIGFVDTRISLAVFLGMPIVYMVRSRAEREAGHRARHA